MTRDEHFKRLNNYRKSSEYLDYASKVEIEVSNDELMPSLLGVRWLIDECIYNEFLEMLPPLNWRGSSFLMCEFTFGPITTKYMKEGDRYFCEFVDVTKEPA